MIDVRSQVATIATYGFFLFALVARQFLDPDKHYEHNEVDWYVPFFTVLQFLFYVGWIKVQIHKVVLQGQVAEDLMKPFGTDDDDFELNYILDRNIRTSFAIVNSVYEQVRVCL